MLHEKTAYVDEDNGLKHDSKVLLQFLVLGILVDVIIAVLIAILHLAMPTRGAGLPSLGSSLWWWCLSLWLCSRL